MNTALQYLYFFIAASFATFGFCILYNVPKKTLLPSSLIGAIGWLIHFSMNNLFTFPSFIATTVAAFTIALLSQLLARRLYVPVIVLVIPAIIPLVPGGPAYNTMRTFVEGEILTAMTYMVETFLTAGAIALGLTINSAFFQVFSPKSFWQRDRRRKLP